MTITTTQEKLITSPPDFSDVTPEQILEGSRGSQAASEVGATAVGGPEAVIAREVSADLASSIGVPLVDKSFNGASEHNNVEENNLVRISRGGYPRHKTPKARARAKWGSIV